MLDIDEEKIREEEALDGYYMLLTSEMETSDDEIIDMYRGLWKIEESFKVTKSELEARPVYVWTKEHIEAHFLKPCIYWVWRVFYIHLAAKVRL